MTGATRNWLTRMATGAGVLSSIAMVAGCTLKITPEDDGRREYALKQTAAEHAPLRSDAWPLRASSGLPEFSDVEAVMGYRQLPPDKLASTRALYSARYVPIDDDTEQLTMTAHARVIGPAWVRWFGGPALSAVERLGSESDVFEVRTWRPEGPPTTAFPDDRSSRQWAEAFEEFARSSSFEQTFSVIWPTTLRPRGVVLVQWPISGGRHVGEVIAKLRRDGWVLLIQRMVRLATAELGGLPAGAKAGDRPNAPIDLSDPRTGGARMARLADEALADQAYATDAALRFLSERYADWPSGPTVLLGFSYGALTAPSVAARLGERLDAMVLVGGGTQLGSIVVTSGLFRTADGSGLFRLNEQDRAVFELDYLGSSRLDAYHVAPRLRGLKTLLVDASGDGIVQPRYADQLWRRLGYPERWTLDSGHTGLFLTIDAMSEDLVGWMNRLSAPEMATPGAEDYHLDRRTETAGHADATVTSDRRVQQHN